MKTKIYSLLLGLALLPSPALADLSAKDLVTSCQAYTNHNGSIESAILSGTCRDYVEAFMRARGHAGGIKPVVQLVAKQKPEGTAAELLGKIVK